jgi:hypothetical protein
VIEFLTQSVTQEHVVGGVIFVYVASGLFGAYVMHLIFKRADEGVDRVERAHINQIVHKTHLPRWVFIVAGGVFWPVLAIVGLTG